MQRLSRAACRFTAAVVVLLSAACGSSGGEDDPGGGGGPPQAPAPAGAGIQQGLSLTALEDGGWVVCHEDAYADTGAPIATILSSCVGPYLMLACRTSATNDVIALAAADARAVVIQPDALSPVAHHVSNGVGWYFTETASWGFFPATETVSRSPCDAGTTMADKRLCWHANEDAELANGFRCGAVPTSTSWRRMVLVHP